MMNNIRRKIHLGISLMICSFVILFCASCTANQNNSQEVETLTYTPVWTPSVKLTPILSSDEEVNTEETDEVIPPDFELQALTPQNIKQIVPIAILQDDSICSSSISSDGKWLARNTRSGVYVYEVDSGEKIASLITNSFVYKSVFSDDGTRLAIISVRSSSPDVVTIRTDASNPYHENYDVTVWQIADQKLLFTKPYEELCGDGINIDLFQFLDDNSLVLNSINADTYVQKACRISGQTGESISELILKSSYGYVRSMALSTDGQILSSVFTLDAMSIQSPRLVNFSFPDGNVLLDRNLEEISTVAFIPQSHNLLFTAGQAAKNLSLEQMTPDGIALKSFPLFPTSSFPVPFTVNQQYVAVSYFDETGVLVFDVNTGEKTKQIFPQTNQALSINVEGEFDGYVQAYLARDNNRLLVLQHCLNHYNGENTSLRLVDLNLGEQTVFSFDTPAESVGDLSPNDVYIAKGGFWNGEIRLWYTNNGQLASVMSGHVGPVNQVVFSPNSAFLASASRDTTACLWDVSTGERIHTFTGHQGEVSHVTFSADGSRLMTSSKDNTLRLWDIENGGELRKFDKPIAEGEITGIWFISDHTVLVDVSGYGEECNGCHASTFLLNVDTGEFTEQPWPWLSTYQSASGEWLLRYGVAPNIVIAAGWMVDGQFQSEMSFPLIQFNDSYEIVLSADGQWIYGFNENGLHVFDRNSGEQVDLAVNYMDRQTSGNGQLEASADGRFLVDFQWAKIVLWGVP